ncbi:TRAP transporter small permease [Roseovarius sp. MMSF_3281]|uniref:TRAP transporter small permease n=1 Tax=Roseovarius sp. MMSF_3281 TaxID=3046694 RepID=UPI00273E600E|nr:TRAP transporter small permease [Roseovarius sp. MMSF_3281]
MGGVLEENKPVNMLSALLARVETLLIGISAAAMAAIMLIVVLDVCLRYLLSSPLTWSYSLIGLYLVGAVFFLALSDTMHHHGHIALDVFVPFLPRLVRHLSQAAGYGISTLFIGVMTWLGYVQSRDAFISDARVAEAVAWPTWIAYALLTVGMGAMCLRCGYRALFHLVSVFAGRDMVELPAPPNTELKSGEHGE